MTKVNSSKGVTTCVDICSKYEFVLNAHIRCDNDLSDHYGHLLATTHPYCGSYICKYTGPDSDSNEDGVFDESAHIIKPT